MSEDMTASEVAAHLGVSNRRIRALIASGQLPARQVAGRWMVPATAVSGFLPKDGGRPMSERSAWTVLASLAAGDDVGVPLRLRRRIAGLHRAELPHVRLKSWMSARGKPFRAWAFEPVLDDLRSDERLVLGGEHVIDGLESSGHVHAYLRAEDLSHVVSDYGLREAANGKVPNVFLWAVSHFDAVPRQAGDPSAVDAIVSALDLLDDGDPRAVGAASDIIERALHAPIAL
jgi:excisionase family DNA binding protein